MSKVNAKRSFVMGKTHLKDLHFKGYLFTHGELSIPIVNTSS